MSKQSRKISEAERLLCCLLMDIGIEKESNYHAALDDVRGGHQTLAVGLRSAAAFQHRCLGQPLGGSKDAANL